MFVLTVLHFRALLKLYCQQKCHVFNLESYDTRSTVTYFSFCCLPVEILCVLLYTSRQNNDSLNFLKKNDYITSVGSLPMTIVLLYIFFRKRY